MSANLWFDFGGSSTHLSLPFSMWFLLLTSNFFSAPLFTAAAMARLVFLLRLPLLIPRLAEADLRLDLIQLWQSLQNVLPSSLKEDI